MNNAPSRLRWAILALLFISTVLNYLDRQTLSILASTVQRDLGISDMGYARIVQFFLIAYTIAYLLAGRITDWLGTRVSLALFVVWWSLANMVTGLVSSAGQLGAARFALGLGEAGNYTAAPKAVSEHFPPQERAFAFGTYTAGAMVGATIAPPLIAWLALSYGWRMAFVVTGALGFVWVAAWLLIYRARQSAGATMQERASAAAPSERVLWLSVLRERPVWGLALSRMIADPVWYFYLFWFPKYLSDERALSLVEVAGIAWIVYLAADIGSIGGGLISGKLVARGMNAPRARVATMGLGAALAPAGMLIAAQPGIGITLALGAMVAFAHLLFQINLGTLIVDLYPTRIVATVFGVIAAGSGLGGIVSTQLVGALASDQNYMMIFLLMGTLHPIAWTVVWWSTRDPGASALRPEPA